LDGKNLKKDFPIFEKRSDLIYFDNACTTFKPKTVIDAISSYYSEYSACAGRSSHSLAKEVDAKVEKARETVAKFVGAKPEELVWTKNTTEAVNLVANTFDFSKRKKVVLSELEHHSSILPFQKLAEAGKITLHFVRAEDGTLKDEDWKAAIDKETALVVVHHTNNSIGTKSNLSFITKLAHDNGALVLVDGAQGVPHAPVDFKKDNYDFLAFSGHKMLGPTGIGCLVVKQDLLKKMPPFLTGGGTVQEVHLDDSGKLSASFLQTQHRFEAGIQDYAGILGLAAACEYLNKLGMKNVEAYEHKLAGKMHSALSAISNIQIYGSPYNPQSHAALFSFNVKGAKPHEIALLLDRSRIATRSGVFCAQPALEAMGQKDGAVRASLYLYNTEEEITIFAEKMGKIAKLYH
jgi:cysteine desulfurase/selenocysteine lyase